MENNSHTVEALKKVSLIYTIGSTPESEDLIFAPKPLEFIFGIGTEGLTAFECALDGKFSGDKGSIEVNTKKFSEIFGHIISQNDMSPAGGNHFYLHYTITGISDTSPGEVVRSMASVVGSDCGGGCGCGCGSH